MQYVVKEFGPCGKPKCFPKDGRQEPSNQIIQRQPRSQRAKNFHSPKKVCMRKQMRKRYILTVRHAYKIRKHFTKAP